MGAEKIKEIINHYAPYVVCFSATGISNYAQNVPVAATIAAGAASFLVATLTMKLQNETTPSGRHAEMLREIARAIEAEAKASAALAAARSASLPRTQPMTPEDKVRASVQAEKLPALAGNRLTSAQMRTLRYHAAVSAKEVMADPAARQHVSRTLGPAKLEEMRKVAATVTQATPRGPKLK